MPVKVAVLCNSLMGIPSLQALARSGRLAALGIPDVPHDATVALRELAPQLGVRLTEFTRATFAESAAAWLRSSGAEAALVYTFPWVIGADLLAVPAAGFLNFHFGLLPQYRGADAIFWEIRNREPFGAVTVHRMETGLDTGPVALEQRVPIGPGDTYGVHMANLAMAGVEVTRKLLPLLENPASIARQPQDETLAKVWPKPGQREVIIDWAAMTAPEVVALVRACNPWNKGAYTFLGGNPLRITVATVAAADGGGKPPGTLLSHAEGLLVVCRENQAIVLETACLESGFFCGKELSGLGIRAGMQFATPRL